MVALLLPFAERRTDGFLVSPEDVDRGLACNCICPGCGHAVMAKQGTEKVWHFAHHKTPSCSDGYEKSVHELAKQLIRERRQLLLPALEAVVWASDAYGRRIEERELVFESKPVPLDECRTTVKLEAVTADVLGRRQEREVLVEITVFHRLMPDKCERLVATGMPAFEIDLSLFKTVQATRERVAQEIFENKKNRHWINHPRLDSAEEASRSRLTSRLETVRVQYEAQMEEHRKREAERRKARQAVRPVTPPTRPARPLPILPPLPSSFGALPFHQPTPVSSDTGERVWRAGLPEETVIRSEQVALANRADKPLMKVIQVTGTITSRGQLQGVTPVELAARWAQELGTESEDVMQFFVDAGYILPGG